MGSKTTSQVTNAANPEAQAAYADVVGKAQSVASTPYNPYTGELVAGLNGTQSSAIGQLSGVYGAAQPYVRQGAYNLTQAGQGLGAVQGYLQAASDTNAGVGDYQGLATGAYGQAGDYGSASASALGGMDPYMALVQHGLGAAGGTYGAAAAAAGMAQPYYGAEAAGLGQVGGYLGAASGMLGQAQALGTPQTFDAAALAQYSSPYTQQVVDATRANLRENDAQQSQGLTSSAIGSGAYGGDRAGVAQAELARQQNLADGQTIAGLYNQGYANAQNQFNTVQSQRQQAAGLLNQGAGQMAGLGSAQLQTALGYGQVGAGLGSNAATLSGIASGQTGNAGAYNTLAQDAGQKSQQLGTLGSLANQTGAGYNTTGQLGLGSAGLYGTLGQLQGTTGQAYGTLAGLYGNLGSLNQSSLISGASAGLQAGTLAQQNAQQQDTAAYNQYMAGLSYPYQNVGFLSNVVQGIGSQEGNTQTTQGNALSSIAGLGTSAIGILGATGGFGANGYLSGLGSSISSAFSDARVKEDMAPIGRTFDGQTMYRFRYKGDPAVRTGLMAQEVEQHTPGAVGSVGGIKTVDYDAATRGAAALGLGARPGDLRPARAMGGPVGLGLSPVGGPTMPMPPMVGLGARPRYDAGGVIDPTQVAAIPTGGLNMSPTALTGAGVLNVGRGLGAGRPLQAQTQGGGQPAGLGVMSAAPSGGTAPVPAGGFGSGSAQGGDGSAGGLSQNAWMGVLSAGLGMMGGTSASGLANIGQGAQQGLQTYLGLQRLDKQTGFQQQELDLRKQQADQTAAYQSGSLALDKQKEDFTERRAQMMLDAAQRAADTLSSSPSSAAAAAPQPQAAPIPGVGRVPAAAVAPTSSPDTQPAASSPAAPSATSDFWSKVSPDSNPLLLTQQAARYQAAGKGMLAINPEGANQLFSQASQLQNRARLIYDNGTVMNRDGSVGLLPGFTEAQAAKASATKQAEAGVSDQHDLVKVADPNGGGEQYMPKSAVMAAAQGRGLAPSGPPGAGSAPGTAAAMVAQAAPYLATNPAFIAKAQEDKAKAEADMDQQFQGRQISRQRLGDLRSIMTKYQTGDLAGAKADAVAFGRAIGIPVSDTETASPQFFQRFGKDAIANVFQNVKDQGGRVLVSEIDGLTKANANAEMSPAANAAILNQGLGIIDYEDQHYKDYMGWRDQNPNAWNSSKFEVGWQGKNNVQQFVDKAGKDFAYKGQDIPAPAQRSTGQMYMTPKGPMRWLGNGWGTN